MFLFKSTGIYAGFIYEGNIFSRDGEYFGWVEGTNVWDRNGNYRGQIYLGNYVVKSLFVISPVPRVPKATPATPQFPNPPPNRLPITLPVGFVDVL